MSSNEDREQKCVDPVDYNLNQIGTELKHQTTDMLVCATFTYHENTTWQWPPYWILGNVSVWFLWSYFHKIWLKDASQPPYVDNHLTKMELLVFVMSSNQL